MTHQAHTRVQVPLIWQCLSLLRIDGVLKSNLPHHCSTRVRVHYSMVICCSAVCCDGLRTHCGSLVCWNSLGASLALGLLLKELCLCRHASRCSCLDVKETGQVMPELPCLSRALPFSSCSAEDALLRTCGALLPLPRLCPRPLLQPCLSGLPMTLPCCLYSFMPPVTLLSLSFSRMDSDEVQTLRQLKTHTWLCRRSPLDYSRTLQSAGACNKGHRQKYQQLHDLPTLPKIKCKKLRSSYLKCPLPKPQLSCTVRELGCPAAGR